MEQKHLKRVDLIFEWDEKNPPIQVLDKTLQKTPDAIILEMIDSGLKGRGGAGFPTGLKWKFTRNEDSDVKYVICNADEGEPGTFKDREILDRVPEKIFTGMAICGYVIGAKEGYIYLRAEYNFLLKSLQQKLINSTSSLKTARLNSQYSCVQEVVPTFVAKKALCLKAWKANAASPAISLPILQLPGTTVNLPLSTMLKPLFTPAKYAAWVPKNSKHLAQAIPVDQKYSRFQVIQQNLASMNLNWVCH